MHSKKLPHLPIKHSVVRAKSRILKQNHIANNPKLRVSYTNQLWVDRLLNTLLARKPNSHFANFLINWVKVQRKQLFMLAVSIGMLVYMLVFVHPKAVANILLSQSYLPLLVISGAVMYSIARLFFGRISAVLLSLSGVLALFLKVHQVWLQPQTIVWLIIVLLCIATCSITLERVLAKHRISDILRHSKVKNFATRRRRS